MTILIASRHAYYVVVGADSLMHRYERGRRVAVTQSKIFKHPTLPLALAASGFAGLANPQLLVADFLVQVLADVKEESDLDLKSITSRICNLIDPLISDAQKKLSPDEAAAIRTKVLIARHLARLADFAVLEFPGTGRAQQTNGFFDNPPSLSAFYRSGKYAKALPFGQVDEAKARARLIATVIDEGIVEERRIYGGKNREVGPPVETVIVDDQGAHAS